ncbi:MAG: thiolase domain-containing protein [Chloroflexi bacterium]|nr:thiolase domain-containing protein [Chloroflexota bacterium]
MAQDTYILGGYQTDFSRNWLKEGKQLWDIFAEVVNGALEATGIAAEDVQVGHVGNFAGELYAMQGHLGAFLVGTNPAFAGLPTARHEAACASGSVAVLAATAELEAGRYDLALVLGIEQMKTVDSARGGDFLGTAGWYEREAKGITYPFPKLFGRLGDEYDRRFGLKDEHLSRISAINFANARKNPLAQTRAWQNDEAKFATQIAGRIKVSDCSQVTDGAVCVLLASTRYAEKYAKGRGVALDRIPRILGWGHRTATLGFDDKIRESEGDPYVLPHTRQAILDAFARAGIADVWGVDAIETHDCFTTSEYMAIDHFGLTPPGQSWQAIEEGVIELDGTLPINPSGGLIGAGHPVGGTGVRQLLDAYRQVTETAGEYQVVGATKVATLNIGGSGTTSCSFVVGN